MEETKKVNIIVCVDDQKGMMFNHRRQSRDHVVREDMLLLVPDKLWVSPYTAKQFAETEQERLLVAEDFLEQAAEGEYCFVEDKDITPYADKIENIILYHWKRMYPADTYFTIPLADFALKERKDLTGNSHPDMIREVYTKKVDIRKDTKNYEE